MGARERSIDANSIAAGRAHAGSSHREPPPYPSRIRDGASGARAPGCARASQVPTCRRLGCAIDRMVPGEESNIMENDFY